MLSCRLSNLWQRNAETVFVWLVTHVFPGRIGTSLLAHSLTALVDQGGDSIVYTTNRNQQPAWFIYQVEFMLQAMFMLR